MASSLFHCLAARCRAMAFSLFYSLAARCRAIASSLFHSFAARCRAMFHSLAARCRAMASNLSSSRAILSNSCSCSFPFSMDPWLLSFSSLARTMHLQGSQQLMYCQKISHVKKEVTTALDKFGNKEFIVPHRVQKILIFGKA